MIISNLKELLKYEKLSNVGVISFDLFDTLVYRKIESVSKFRDIHSNYVCKHILDGLTGSEFLEIRNSIDTNIRSLNKQTGFDAECSINKLYSEMSRKLDLDAETENNLVNSELILEKLVVFTFDQVRELMQNICGTKRVIAVTDTDYPSWLIKELLKELKLHDYFDYIYCSCEIGFNKLSGNIFNKVIESENISSSELIHIGDKIANDYIMPRTKGIRSELYYDSDNIKRKLISDSLNELSNKSTFWNNYNILFSINSNIYNFNRNDSFYGFGKGILGPLLSVFIHMLINQIRNQEFEEIFFIARDGFILKKVFDLFVNRLEKTEFPRSRYLCINRNIAFSSSLKNLDSKVLDICTLGNSTKTADALYRLGFNNKEEIEDILQYYKLDSEIKSTDKLRYELSNLFQDEKFRRKVLSNSLKTRSLLKDYLFDINLISSERKQRILLIDVGWLGTIQDSLETAFDELEYFPSVHGYYIGLDKSSNRTQTNKNGLLYDYRESVPEEMYLTFIKDIIEMACSARHGPITGYSKVSDNCVKPVFNNSNLDLKTLRNVLKIQKGIIDFAKEYLEFNNLLDIKEGNLKYTVLKLLDSFFSNPNARYMSTLEDLSNSNDFNIDESNQLIRYFKTKDIINYDNFIKDFKNRSWREASISNISIPLVGNIYNAVKRIYCCNKSNEYMNNP